MNSPYRTASDTPPKVQKVESDSLTARIHYLVPDGTATHSDKTWKGTARYSPYYEKVRGNTGSCKFMDWYSVKSHTFLQVDDAGKIFVHPSRILMVEVLKVEEVVLMVEVP